MRFVLILLLAGLCRAGASEICWASWEQFSDQGKLAANGHPFDANALSAASLAYPIGTRLKVTDMGNGLSVVVTVTDRINPRYRNRLDLSPRAFGRLNGLELGIARVRVERLPAR